MEDKEVIDELIELITASVVEKVFADDRFTALVTPKVEEVEEVEEIKEEVVEEEVLPEEEVEEVVDKRTTIEKIRDRLRGIK